MIHEPAALCKPTKDRPLYWLPAGRLDAGEGFVDAAIRETKEEGGVDIRVVGVLRFQLSSSETWRVVLLAEPLVGEDEMVPCKSVPDFESVGAMWVDVTDLEKLDSQKHFRASDPLTYFPMVDNAIVNDKLESMYSIDTPAFRNLEAMARRLTAQRMNEDEVTRQVWSAWKKLKYEYPEGAVFPNTQAFQSL
jgi:ADP-ribose pyrophosphatase YjhB (NUDIX family)